MIMVINLLIFIIPIGFGWLNAEIPTQIVQMPVSINIAG